MLVTEENSYHFSTQEPLIGIPDCLEYVGMSKINGSHVYKSDIIIDKLRKRWNILPDNIHLIRTIEERLKGYHGN